MNLLVNKYFWLSVHDMWFSAFFFPWELTLNTLSCEFVHRLMIQKGLGMKNMCSVDYRMPQCQPSVTWQLDSKITVLYHMEISRCSKQLEEENVSSEHSYEQIDTCCAHTVLLKSQTHPLWLAGCHFFLISERKKRQKEKKTQGRGLHNAPLQAELQASQPDTYGPRGGETGQICMQDPPGPPSHVSYNLQRQLSVKGSWSHISASSSHFRLPLWLTRQICTDPEWLRANCHRLCNSSSPTTSNGRSHLAIV